MKKVVIIPIIIILVIGLAATVSFLLIKMNTLAKSESTVASLNNTVKGLNTDISDLQSKLTDSQTSLTTAQGKISSLEDDIETANVAADKSSQDLKNIQDINSTLNQKLKIVTDPRHFQSVSELTDWLAKDDTNTKYKEVGPITQAYILQLRALRAGYILSTEVTYQRNDPNTYWAELAVIDGEIWFIDPAEDKMYNSSVSISPIPSHPEPLP
jgi:hypothetical protein